MNPVLKQLGIRRPILLAPMAGVSGGRLAAEVSTAGGLGIVAGGYCDRSWLMQELDLAGDESVGVGFISWKLAETVDLLDEVLERQPRAIFLSFGDIAPFSDRVRKHSIPLIAQVQTVEGAGAAVTRGADLIVAQGSEAGGHGGARGTLSLVPAIRDAIGDVPLVAAGGIGDGRGIAAALMLGADAVLCGTAFYATCESLAHPVAKELAVAARGDGTRRSRVFDAARALDWPEPWTLRAMTNAFHEQWSQDPGAINAAQQDEFRRAVAAGDPDVLPVIVGEAVDLVGAIEPASKVFARLVEEARQSLSEASGLACGIWDDVKP